MIRIFKSVLFVVLIAPLASLGMEGVPDKITLGKGLRHAISHGDMQRALWFIDYGADLNEQTDEGVTALMFAIIHDQPRMVQILIEQGADLHLKGKDGFTALQCAENGFNLSLGFLLVQAMLNKVEREKERVFTFLNCLNRMPRNEYVHLRNVFKPYLRKMFHEPYRKMLCEIGSIKNAHFHRPLTGFLVEHEARKKLESFSSSWSQWCSIQ